MASGALPFPSKGGKRKVLYGRTRKEAGDKLAAALRDVQQGLPIPGRRLTTQAYLTDWLTNTVASTRRPKTYLTYEFALRVHIIPAIGSIPLAKLSPHHVQKLQQDMADKGLSRATIALARAVLGAALAQAAKWGLVGRNVAALVDAPIGPQQDAQVLRPDQADALLSAAAGQPFEHLIRFMLATGLRISEALGLRWSDIDPQFSQLRVRQQLLALPGRVKSFGEPKSASGKRVIPIIPSAAEALHAQRARVLQYRLCARDLWREHDLVFSNEIGEPIDARLVRCHLHRLAAAAGLPPTITPHTLRHSAATYLPADGVPDRVVMEIMGHSSIAMTSRYEHVLSDMLVSAGDRLAQFLSSASA